MDLVDITEITASTDNTINWLRANTLLKANHLCCENECYEVKSKTRDGREYKCDICKKRYSLRTDSFFYNVHINLRYLLLLTYLFAQKCSVGMAAKFLGQKCSPRFIAMWFDKLRDIMTVHLLQNPIQLGGPDSVVEIDETALGRKQKYHRGSFKGSGVKWVLGIIDRTTKKCHVQLVPNRTRDVLFDIITQYVIRDSVIHTDEAPVYRTLPAEGYEHYTVKHKETYVAPDGTHTNTIESLWSHIKEIFKEKHGVHNQKLGAHLDEFLWRWNRKSDGNVFELLVQDIAVQYRV